MLNSVPIFLPAIRQDRPCLIADIKGILRRFFADIGLKGGQHGERFWIRPFDAQPDFDGINTAPYGDRLVGVWIGVAQRGTCS